MRQMFRFSIAAALLCSADVICMAGPEWVERDDAGALPPTAQVTTEGTAGPVVKQIKGTITAAPLLNGSSDFEDMFLVNITDPENFVITTTAINPKNPDNPGTAEFDTVLYLFSAESIIEGSGTFALGLLANDDTQLPLPVKGPGTILSGSTITPNSTDGSEAQLVEPGLYYIVIATTFTEPLGFAGKGLAPIFTFKSPTEISGPDGPAGNSALVAWTPEPPPGSEALTGFGGQYTIACEGVEVAVPNPVTLASLDIRPGVCPNNFNVYLPGHLFTALLGTANFNVNDVNTATIQISRVDGVGSPVTADAGSFTYVDVATPFFGDQCDCHTAGADGFVDLHMKFHKQSMIDNLEFDDLECGTVLPLRVSGNLNDGTPFTSFDCIVIVD